jgi:hypothetical protein
MSMRWRMFSVAFADGRILQWINGPGSSFKDERLNDFDVPSALENAQNMAATLIQEPNVKSIALVDLYSRPNPVIVLWCQDVNGKARFANRAPSAALEKSLQGFLQWLQVNGHHFGNL